MRYHKIRKMDISNGPGVRVSIFMQGCTFNCKNCFNPETHDFNGGREFLDETIEKVLDLCSLEHIVGLSILGGEPMHPKNIDGTTKLAKAFKERYPDKTIWVWSGFLFDRDLKNKEVNWHQVLIYKENDVNLKKLPDCDDFNPLSNYEGLWTSIFVKPLAWLILKIGNLLNSYGTSIIATCLLLRMILMPITKKTAIQSELIKKAQPELEKLEKKYKGKEV